MLSRHSDALNLMIPAELLAAYENELENEVWQNVKMLSASADLSPT